MKKTLLVASSNPGKIIEIKAILSSLDINIVSSIDLGLDIHVHETGATYAENALLKALAYHQQTELTTLADDSGLEVDLLDGAPGIFSARYSPKEEASDADRRQYLLEKLDGKPSPWNAHFHCAAILIDQAGSRFESSGQCDGVIIPEEHGSGGFGYDPIFYLPENNATMAEIPAGLKNQISHRAIAIQAIIPTLKQVFLLD